MWGAGEVINIVPGNNYSVNNVSKTDRRRSEYIEARLSR